MTRLSARLTRMEPARVCIIKTSSLGDVVHALPILSALRGLWPGSHLSWVVNRSYREVLQGHPDLDELIVYNRGLKPASQKGSGSEASMGQSRFLPTPVRAPDDPGINGMAGLLWRLAHGRFDLTIDLQGLFRSALMTASTLSRIRVGLADAREGAALVLHAPRRCPSVRYPCGGARDASRFRTGRRDV